MQSTPISASVFTQPSSLYVCVFMEGSLLHVCVYRFSPSHKDISHVGVGPTLKTSSSLDHICTQVPGVRTSTSLSGEDTVRPITYGK